MFIEGRQKFLVGFHHKTISNLQPHQKNDFNLTETKRFNKPVTPALKKLNLHKKSKTYYNSPIVTQIANSSKKTLTTQNKISQRRELKKKILKIPVPGFHKKNKTLIYPSNNTMSNASSYLHFTQNQQINLTNKKLIIYALQRLKFEQLSVYPTVLNVMNKSKKELFCILVYRDENYKHFSFRALYEINANENVGYKIFGINFCPTKLYAKELTKLYTFNVKKGLFFKVKTEYKKFDNNTVLMM